MKRLFLILLSVFFVFAVIFFIAINVWIGFSVEKNIALAQGKYNGSAEDALIEYLQDEKNSTKDRTHIAIWTLGQIGSKKALPILEALYEDDPEGKTCYGRHDVVLCQYEIYKAIKAIKEEKYNFLYLFRRNK